MLIIKTNQPNSLVVTVSQNSELTNPEYLFSFTHIFSKQNVSFIPIDVSLHKSRYDEFYFVEGSGAGDVRFPYEGLYLYSISEQPAGSGNLDPALAYNVVENGEAQVIVQSAITVDSQFDTWVSPNEFNSNIIFAPDEPTPPPAPEPTCPPQLTAACPTFLTRYSPTNSIYFKNSGTTADFLANFTGACAPSQIALDESRLFMVDGCSNYYQYDYTISPTGCFNLTLVDKWDVWASSGATPNASPSIAIYDNDNLIIGESAQFEQQTGSTLYLYNLTTSGLTKWLEIGNGAQVYNVYYNTGNTQTLLSYGSASGGTGYYQLYSGSTNPQLLSQIPGTYSNAGSTMYFSGNTAIAVNVAGIQFELDFVNQTITRIDNQSGFPVYYVGFGDGFSYLANIAQQASCYTYDIPYQQPIIDPSALGALWWIDFTDASTLNIVGGEIQTATDKISNVVFSAGTGGPVYDPVGYLGVSGDVRSNASQLRNQVGEYSNVDEYTWFGFVYDDAITQRGGKIFIAAQNPGWTAGQAFALVIDTTTTPVWRFQNRTASGASTQLNTDITFSAWTPIAMRTYNNNGDNTLEVWENGSIIASGTTAGNLYTSTDPVFSLMFDGGYDFNTEQFFFDKKLTDSEMAQMFLYLSNKY